MKRACIEKGALRERNGAFTQKLDEREKALLLCKPREVKQVPNLHPPHPKGQCRSLESCSGGEREGGREKVKNREKSGFQTPVCAILRVKFMLS